MTIREIIEFVDEVFPNTFSPETKTRWLSQCDAAIWNDVMLLPAYSFPGYRWDFDADRPLLAPEAYEQMYVHWLCAQMHKAHQEIAEYANDAELYNAFQRRFVIWYADTFDPAHGGMMPLPPSATIRRGETATVILWIPCAADEIDELRVIFTGRDAAFTRTQNDVTVSDHLILCEFTQEQSLALSPGVYTVQIVGTTKAGKRFETQVNLQKISVLDTMIGSVL